MKKTKTKKNGRLKKTEFFNYANSQSFFAKTTGNGLGLVGYIDLKGINVAQPIWSSGCPT